MLLFQDFLIALNIVISVVVDYFNRIKDEDKADALLIAQQVLYVRERR